MKKKILSVLLALSLVISFMPVISFAGSEQVLVSLHSNCIHEAEIVSTTSAGRTVITHYDTLQEAVDTVASGETATIKVLKDISLPEGSSTITIKKNSNVTINFGAHKLSSEMSGVVFVANGDLKITGGTLNTTGTRMVYANANVTLQDCKIQGEIANASGSVEISSGEFDGNINCDTINIAQGAFAGDITARAITINDGIFDGVISNGNSASGNSLIINGGVFHSEKLFSNIAAAGQGPIIKGGMFKAEPPVAYVADGYFAKKSTQEGDTFGYYTIRKEVKIFPNVGEKVYDGKPIDVNPTATSNSTTVYGVLFSKEYFDISDAGSTKLASAPSNAGTYRIVVDVDGSDQHYASYAGSPVSENFSISKAYSLISLSNVDYYYDSDGKYSTISVGAQKSAVENQIISSLSYQVYKDGSFSEDKKIADADWYDESIDEYLKNITGDSIEVRTASGAGITLSEALRTVGTYTITLSESVVAGAPSSITDNINLTLADRLLDRPAATMTVAAAVPDKLGLDASLSTVENGVMTLEPGVITDTKLQSIAAANTGEGLLLNINTGLTADNVTDIVIPADQIKVLADYMRGAGTAAKFGALKIIFSELAITLDSNAIKYLDENAGEASSFRISGENIEKERLSTLPVLRALNPKTAIESLGSGVVCGLRISIDGLGNPAVSESGEDNLVKAFSSLGAGKVSADIPLTLSGNNKGSDYGVYYISTTSVEPICLYGDYTASGKTGKVTFKSSNLSYFVLSPLKEDDVKPCDGGKDCPCSDYTDLNSSYWYHDYVDYVLKNGIMNGTGAGLFEPEGSVTRAMVVVMLYRLAEEPAVGSITTEFTDLTDDWYINAVKWANKSGVVNGYDEKHFGPSDPVTREQLALILYNYYTKVLNKAVPEADLATDDIMKGFSDYKKIDSWAMTALKWANKAGIVNGYDNYGVKSIKPLDGAMRQEIAKMFTVLKRDIIDAAATKAK